MNRERKVISYKFGDFKSPRSVRQMGKHSSGRIDKQIQLSTARALDPQLKQYREI